MKDDSTSIAEKLITICSIPKEVALGLPIITISGRSEVIVENYNGIIEYDDKVIRLRTKSGQLKISGIGLNIIYYGNDEMKITGKITIVEYT